MHLVAEERLSEEELSRLEALLRSRRKKHTPGA
jgi:hypothetical protein